MFFDLLKRAAGFDPLPEPLVEAECRREIDAVLSIAFPQLSRIEKERQHIANKRERLTGDREAIRAERDRPYADIAELDEDERDINRILEGLQWHEAAIAPKATEIEANLEDRRNGTERRAKRGKPMLAAAE